MTQTRDDPMKQTRTETAVITTTGRVRAARLAIRAARPRRRTSILLWAVQIPLAALFVNFAVPKLTGSQQAVQEFGLIGAGQWLRYFVGTAELAGAIGLLTRWLAGLAAGGSPPTWPVRPLSTPRCCTTPPTASTSR